MHAGKIKKPKGWSFEHNNWWYKVSPEGIAENKRSWMGNLRKEGISNGECREIAPSESERGLDGAILLLLLTRTEA